MATDIWGKLAVPFPPETVKERQGPKQHQGECQKQYGACTLKHKMLSYVDARDVALRLDDTVGAEGWTFACDVVPGTEVVHGRLALRLGALEIFREDHGYPNSDRDEEPIKAATSDCFKRCGVGFGIGRHLYTDNKAAKPATRPAPPAARPAAPPAAQPVAARPAVAADPNEPPEISDAELDSLAGIMGPPPQQAPTGIPQCPVHKWDMRPDKRASHAGEFGCSGKMPDGSWCSERAR